MSKAELTYVVAMLTLASIAVVMALLDPQMLRWIKKKLLNVLRRRDV